MFASKLRKELRKILVTQVYLEHDILEEMFVAGCI